MELSTRCDDKAVRLYAERRAGAPFEPRDGGHFASPAVVVVVPCQLSDGALARGCGLASPLGGESEASHEHPTQGGVDPSGKREGAKPHTWAGCIVTWEMQTQLGHNSPFGQAGCGLMTDRPAQDRSSRRLGTSASSPRFCKLHPRLVARCFAPAAPDPRPLAVLRHLHAAWRREQTLQGSARATI
jgi:hypothetical protein